MEGSESNNTNRSFCKICAQNGYSAVPLYWHRDGEKEDGTPKWIAFKDHAGTVRHIHKPLEPKAAVEETFNETMAESAPIGSCKTNAIKELPEYPNGTEMKKTLTSAYELSPRQSRLLKNVLDNLEYFRVDNS
jgi:hypothetical protein